MKRRSGAWGCPEAVSLLRKYYFTSICAQPVGQRSPAFQGHPQEPLLSSCPWLGSVQREAPQDLRTHSE